MILMYYDILLQRDYKYDELYEMTIKELKNAVINANKGLAYKLYKQATLYSSVLAGKLPDKIEKACKELYPPQKTYEMPDWVRKRYNKQRGVK